MDSIRRLTLAVALSASLLAAPAVTQAATFSNGGAINTNDNANGSPYPSTISVSGVSGPITDLNVRLNSFTHPQPFQVGIVLVGPGGQSLLLMDAVTPFAPALPASNLTLTIDDEAMMALPSATALASSSYRPASYVASDYFPPPGPEFAYGNPGPGGGGTQTLSTIFDGTSPNGTWKLFVRDFTAGDSGQIAAGWSLVFPGAPASPASPATHKKCKKGRKLKKGKCVKKKRKKKP